MNTEFFAALDLLEKEKGIPRAYMIEKIEAAIASAVKKDYGSSDNLVVELSEEKKDLKVYIQKEVVEEVENPQTEITLENAREISKRVKKVGDICKIELKTKAFGRIAAQTAKQVIIQGIREAERGLIFQEFESKEQELLSCVVQRVDPVTNNVTLEVPGVKATALLIANEQIPGEHLEVGDHVKVYVVEVRNGLRGPQVIISRTHPGLVKRLFEIEVPEIFEGIVEIKSISREAGSRTKMAVYSEDPNVDAIGACIGARGARISSIVDELAGEKIDIVKYSEDIVEFVKEALSPSDVISVEVAEDEKSCRVIVPDDQLSLAIGKSGQNARLAAKLTGIKIDIKPESQA